MKKKMLCFLMTFALIGSIVGCGSADNTGNTNEVEKPQESSQEAPKEEGQPTEAAATEKKETALEPCTLTFLSWYPQEKYQPILDAFAAEYPDIQVEFQYAAPVADYLEKMQVLTSTGEVPDVFYIAAENKTEMIENGYCADLSETEAVSKLVDTNRSTYEADGKTYGFAPTTWIGGFFYNKDMFSQLGLEAPTTWDQLLNVCKVLTESGTRPIIERGEWFWNSFLGTFMNDYLVDDLAYHDEVLSGEKTFADGWGTYIDKWYQDMIVPGYVGEDLVSVSSQEFFSEFATGNAGMLAGHAGHLKEVNMLEPEFEIGFFPMPGATEDIKVAYGAVDCAVAISATTEYAKQAETFLNFISREDIIPLYQEMNGYVIGMKDAVSAVDPILADIAKMYSEGKISVYIPQGNWGAYGTGLQQQLIASSQRLLLGEIDSATFTKEMQDKLEELQSE